MPDFDIGRDLSREMAILGSDVRPALNPYPPRVLFSVAGEALHDEEPGPNFLEQEE